MVNIEIKRKNGQTAILISFRSESEKFESPSERNKFFSDLYGRKQTVPGKKKTYVYRRPGLLDDIPNLKVDNSVFIVMQEHMRRMQEFFKEWNQKVEFQTFPVILNKEQEEKLKEKERIVPIE